MTENELLTLSNWTPPALINVDKNSFEAGKRVQLKHDQAQLAKVQKRRTRHFDKAQCKPELEKEIIRILIEHTTETKAVARKAAKELLALSDISELQERFAKLEETLGDREIDLIEAKKEEREKVMNLLEKEYPAITCWPCWQTLRGEGY